jgi:hypothetical protein
VATTAAAAAMDPWIGGQPSLSLDLNVGLPTAHPVAPAATKVLVEENFLAVRKDREVMGACAHAAARSNRGHE